MPKKYDKDDVDTQRELQDIHTTLKDMKESMEGGFCKLNSRLDNINGSVKAHDIELLKLDSTLSNHEKVSELWATSHDTHHKEYEDGIGRKVSSYSIIASIIGATLVAVVGVFAWFSNLFK